MLMEITFLILKMIRYSEKQLVALMVKLTESRHSDHMERVQAIQFALEFIGKSRKNEKEKLLGLRSDFHLCSVYIESRPVEDDKMQRSTFDDSVTEQPSSSKASSSKKSLLGKIFKSKSKGKNKKKGKRDDGEEDGVDNYDYDDGDESPFWRIRFPSFSLDYIEDDVFI